MFTIKCMCIFKIIDFRVRQYLRSCSGPHSIVCKNQTSLIMVKGISSQLSLPGLVVQTIYFWNCFNKKYLIELLVPWNKFGNLMKLKT